jgi:RNA polymerase sigma-70 factor (ECF subfamily)
MMQESMFEPELRHLHGLAAARWPGVQLAPERFAARLAAVVPADAPDPRAALAALHAADLYLACACGDGDRAAIDLLDEHFLTPVAGFLQRRGFPEDVKQVVAEHLLVAREGADRRIARYAGRAPLETWMRLVALHRASRSFARDDERRALGELEALWIGTTEPDPELSVMRTQCRSEFREAFAVALAELDARARNVVRFHFIDGLTADMIAATYGVSRRTVHRWLQDALARLAATTRRRLGERLKLSTHDLDSLVRGLDTALASVHR